MNPWFLFLRTFVLRGKWGRKFGRDDGMARKQMFHPREQEPRGVRQQGAIVRWRMSLEKGLGPFAKGASGPSCISATARLFFGIGAFQGLGWGAGGIALAGFPGVVNGGNKGCDDDGGDDVVNFLIDVGDGAAEGEA